LTFAEIKVIGRSMRCDSHVHIIGPITRYPQLATRTYLAPPASLDALCRSAAPSGIERFVIVQPSFYGADNTVLLERRAHALFPDTVAAAYARSGREF
jgi:predicted TIM-barrel fold metal-dependent hydrolase